MKPLPLALCAVALLATTSVAYVRPAHLPHPNPGRTAVLPVRGADDQPGTSTDPGPGAPHRAPPAGTPANPVPEPATIVLASMGLIAIGAAARRRRH